MDNVTTKQKVDRLLADIYEYVYPGDFDGNFTSQCILGKIGKGSGLVSFVNEVPYYQGCRLSDYEFIRLFADHYDLPPDFIRGIYWGVCDIKNYDEAMDFVEDEVQILLEDQHGF